MNLKESIRRILREDKDYTKLLKSIIDSSDIFDYKHFCGYDLITPEERSDQYNFLNKNKIPYLIKVYFVGGPNSEVWPRTQAIRNKELDLMEELHEYIKSFVPFNIEMMGSHVNSCEGYHKLMKRKYSTDDLQESIRRILKETNTEKMISLVGQYMNAMYPDFKDGVVDLEEYDRIDGRIWMEVYRKPNSEHVYAKYYNSKKELELDLEIANSLESMFNDNMTYVIEWFNNEFGTDAEYVTYIM